MVLPWELRWDSHGTSMEAERLHEHFHGTSTEHSALMGTSVVLPWCLKSAFRGAPIWGLPRQFSNDSTMLPWSITWCFHFSLALPWDFHSASVGLPRYLHGSTLLPLENCHANTVLSWRLPLCFLGNSMVLLWCFHGTSMVLPWDFYDASMGLPRNFHMESHEPLPGKRWLVY